MHFDPSKKLDDNQVKEIVKEIIRFGNIVYGRHVRQRMLERGYTTRDLLYIFKEGRIIKNNFNHDRQNWSYTFQCEDLDGTPGAVVTAILDHRTLFLITVLGGVENDE